ncbi:hypothetical protein BHE18_07605 [Rossellomorea aquimaris]|uniref:Uncharacterized protein n=2 Tax=Rossellomorea aquimaris TaxID=189382 RepID=A0A1J6WXA7_9BACI|nr:hypothetical protein BHE18_07605 [Rossellomorea aquimaris]
MGYIAPIPHYQYKQYQEREMKVNKHPFRFFPVQPAKALKNNPEETGRDEIHTGLSGDQGKGVPSLIRQPHKKIIPQELLAKATGKGTYFNEYV